MCFHLRKLDFHTWKVDPSNSLTKRAASLHQTGRRIWHVDIFEIPANRESFTGMKFTFIIAFYLLLFLKSTQGCKNLLRQELSQLSARTLCPNKISRTFTAFWLDNVRCPTVISTTGIQSGKGFIGSFEEPWSECRSQITDPDPEHPKGMHPKIHISWFLSQ